MPISKLLVGGFRSLRDPVEIPLAPITLMFGPNSAGKSAVKEAWCEFRRLLDLKPSIDSAGSPWFSQLLSALATDSNAHVQSAVVDGEENLLYRVLLGCEIDSFDSEEASGNSGRSVGAGLGLGLYRRLKSRQVTYLISSDATNCCASYSLSSDGDTVFAFHSYEAAIQQGLVETAPSRSIYNTELDAINSFGLVQINTSSPLLDKSDIAQLLDRVKELSKNEHPAIARSIKTDGSMLSVRVDSTQRRMVSWQASFVEPYEYDERLDRDFLRQGAIVDELISALNELTHQTEASICREMDLAHVSGDRSKFNSSNLKFTWPLDRDESLSDAIRRDLSEFAFFLGTKEAEEYLDAGILEKYDINKDDFVNEVIGGTLFHPKKYKVRAELLEVKEQVWACRQDDEIGGTTTEYRTSLYLNDEQNRVLDFEQVGSGVSYALLPLVAMWAHKRSWIEQPELHLHPAAQCEMGDAIVRAFNRGRFTITETHSEHLLLRILKRIRQTSAGQVPQRELACQPEAVAVLYFSPQPDGSTHVHQLRVSRSGDFMDEWPNGFFEERSRELFDE